MIFSHSLGIHQVSTDMHEFFFVGIISAIALGVFLIKSIMFVVHIINLKTSDAIINKNLFHIRQTNLRAQQIQSNQNSIDSVINWKFDDPRQLTEDLRQQFLTKTKTRRTPINGQYSPRERVPLATTDLEEIFDDEDHKSEDSVPIYTYNPSIGGTQV